MYSVLAIGFLSFIVWAHHMYLTGMGTKISAFFQTTTMIISIPSVIILTCLFISLWGGSIRFNTPMLFALAFLPMFGIGGLTGLPLASTPATFIFTTLITSSPIFITSWRRGRFLGCLRASIIGSQNDGPENE